MTYAAGTAESTIVWIVTAFREEHRQALDWLSENTSDNAHFFGVELQDVRIVESLRAPVSNVVAQPNDWQKQVRAATQAGAVSGKGTLYVRFWRRFLERVHAEHPDRTRSRHPGPENWSPYRSECGTAIPSSEENPNGGTSRAAAPEETDGLGECDLRMSSDDHRCLVSAARLDKRLETGAKERGSDVIVEPLELLARKRRNRVHCRSASRAANSRAGPRRRKAPPAQALFA